MTFRLLPAAIAALLLIGPAHAQTPKHPTPAQAKAMLRDAIAYYNKNGRENALKEFNRKTGAFSKGELYVFCIGADRTLIADSRYPQYLGQDADQIRDSKGKSLGGAFLEAARKSGELRYNWFNPATQLIEPKVSFVAFAGKDVCGVGTYDVK